MYKSLKIFPNLYMNNSTQNIILFYISKHKPIIEIETIFIPEKKTIVRSFGTCFPMMVSFVIRTICNI